MVCCLLCFRRGKCVAHLLLPPLEHSTASSVALPHVSHSHIFYVASVHSICPFWSFTFSNQSSFFFVAFFVFVCLCLFLFPSTPPFPSFMSLCLCPMTSPLQIIIHFLSSIQTCSQQHKQSVFLLENSFFLLKQVMFLFVSFSVD